MDFPRRVHDPSCRKFSVGFKTTKNGPPVPVCDCGFHAWLAAQDHSKNVPTVTDPSVKLYDARDEWAPGKMKLTVQFDD
jgi:hypothetical protein